MRKFLAVSLCFYLLFAGLIHANAQEQSSARVSLYSLKTGDFPTITAGMDVTDSAGNVVTGLKPDEITLLEDNQSRPLVSLEEVQTGVEFVLALDPGPTFAFRDANAVTRYDKIVQVLKDWAASHPDTLGDDLSLIPTYGTPSTHLAKTAAFSDALACLPAQPAIHHTKPEYAGTCPGHSHRTGAPAGMKRIVLFVTSPTSVEAIPDLQNLTERAAAQHVRVDVWIVASDRFLLVFRRNSAERPGHPDRRAVCAVFRRGAAAWSRDDPGTSSATPTA